MIKIFATGLLLLSLYGCSYKSNSLKYSSPYSLEYLKYKYEEKNRVKP